MQATSSPVNQIRFKIELALIALGILIMLFSIYQYMQPPGPPEVTIVSRTTTQPTSTTSLPARTTTTTMLKYRPGITLATQTWASTTTMPDTGISLLLGSTTTLIPPSCLNSQLDLDEFYIDCGMQCGSCVALNLNGNSWTKYLNENLWLKFENASRVQVGSCVMKERKDRLGGLVGMPTRCFENLYTISIMSTETIPDKRQLALGETAYIDNHELKIMEDHQDKISVYVKKNPDTLEITPEYVVLSLGGTSCNFANHTGFCQRHWMGYKFEIKERETSRIRVDVTLPSGKKMANIWLTQGKTTTIDGASVGLLYAYNKGYSTIYVKKFP